MLYNGFHLAASARTNLGRIMQDEMRYALTIGATVMVFVPAAWALLFWRRREHARIGS